MNKKTTRLSSIALALMMVLMVALTLVPVSAAGAAGATVDITVDESGADDSKNIIVIDEKTYTLKVSEVIWADSIDKDVDSVRMTLRNWADVEVTGYKDVIMTKSATEDGIYTKSFEALDSLYNKNKAGTTGLYTMELWRNFKDGTRDQTSITVGAFWLADDNVSGAAEWTETSTSIKAMENTTSKKIYVAPKAKLEFNAGSISGFPTGSEIRVINPVTKNSFVAATLSSLTDTKTYTLPSDIAHGTELEFKVLKINIGAKVCTIHKADADSSVQSTATDPHKAIVDAKGPEVDDIYITNADYLGYVYNNIMFQNTGLTGDTFVEVKEIDDADVGTTNADAPVARFVNVLNANQKHDSDDLTLNTGTDFSGYIANNTSWGVEIDLTALTGADVILVDQQWYMDIVATDDLGNETVKRYGRVNVLENYVPISKIRVESQNVIEMYKGQKLTLDDLINRNVTVYMEPTGASFTDSTGWTWALNAAASGIITIDEETNEITATAAGEARLYAKVLPKFDGEPGNTSSDYLRILVTNEPTVSSITLNNSTMNIAPGASQKLTATTNPAGVDVTWESSSSAVATVSADGTVTGVANGTAVIFAKAGAQVASCTVTVSGGAVTVTGISLNKTAMSLTAGASETLFATTTPAGGAISWNTSDASVATVDNAGKVTAQKAGTATITATSGSYSATCVVTVTGTPETLEPNQWYQDDAGNIYYSNEHSQLTVGWKKIGGYWYLFDYSTAVMKKGWAKDAGTWYYLQSDGKMKTGWLKDGSTWYYLQASGAMKTGWLKDGGVWYYLKDSGAMATGWVKVSGIWYYLQGSGAMKEGWLLESGVWYYLTPSSGAMLANGTYTVEGRKSQFAASGRWLGYV